MARILAALLTLTLCWATIVELDHMTDQAWETLGWCVMVCYGWCGARTPLTIWARGRGGAE